jgi:hypothetical protein
MQLECVHFSDQFSKSQLGLIVKKITPLTRLKPGVIIETQLFQKKKVSL